MCLAQRLEPRTKMGAKPERNRIFHRSQRANENGSEILKNKTEQNRESEIFSVSIRHISYQQIYAFQSPKYQQKLTKIRSGGGQYTVCFQLFEQNLNFQLF